MPWTRQGGWTDPWLPLEDTRRNVEDERSDPASTLHYTRDLIALRRRLPDLRTGSVRGTARTGGRVGLAARREYLCRGEPRTRGRPRSTGSTGRSRSRPSAPVRTNASQGAFGSVLPRAPSSRRPLAAAHARVRAWTRRSCRSSMWRAPRELSGGTSVWGSTRSGSTSSSRAFRGLSAVARGRLHLYLSEHTGDARPNTLIHLYVDDIDAVSKEFGIPVDEDGLAGRECDLEDPDGNRLRVATRRS